MISDINISDCVCVLGSVIHFGDIKRDKGFEKEKKKARKSKNNSPAVAQEALHLPYMENVHVNGLSVTY